MTQKIRRWFTRHILRLKYVLKMDVEAFERNIHEGKYTTRDIKINGELCDEVAVIGSDYEYQEFSTCEIPHRSIREGNDTWWKSVTLTVKKTCRLNRSRR